MSKKTSKQIVTEAMAGKSTERAPRQMWLLPWATNNHRDEVRNICESFPDDIIGSGADYYGGPGVCEGDAYEVGLYTDPWGCVFENVQKGVIGEVKNPLVREDDWSDWSNVHFPEEWLAFTVNGTNKLIEGQDKFVLGGCCPRPFEQLQFIRGTENLYIDLLDPPVKFWDFIEKMHDFYCRLLKKWSQIDIDGLQFMDDWGSQQSLLINPKIWDKIFAPMYRDYIDIAHKAGKKIFMHSDGYTLDILPKLIDMGLDAINTQIFCIGIDKLKQFKGKITFWGEIDRQYILNRGTVRETKDAVKKVYDTLWDNGYCIAQCEFGAGAKPENVLAVFETWDELTKKC